MPPEVRRSIISTTMKDAKNPKWQQDGVKLIANIWITSTRLTSRTKRLATKELDIKTQSY